MDQSEQERQHPQLTLSRRALPSPSLPSPLPGPSLLVLPPATLRWHFHPGSPSVSANARTHAHTPTHAPICRSDPAPPALSGLRVFLGRANDRFRHHFTAHWRVGSRPLSSSPISAQQLREGRTSREPDREPDVPDGKSYSLTWA